MFELKNENEVMKLPIKTLQLWNLWQGNMMN